MFRIPNWSTLLFIHYLQRVPLDFKPISIVIHPLSTRCTFDALNWSLLLFIHYLQGVLISYKADPHCYSSIIYKVYLWCPKLTPAVIHPLSTRCTFGVPNWPLLLFLHYLQGVSLASQTDPCYYSSIIYKVYFWCPKLTPVVIHPLSTRCTFGVPSWSHCYSSIIYKVYLWRPKLIPIAIHPLSTRCTFGIPNWSLLLFIHYLQGVPLVSQTDPCCYSSIIYKVYLWRPKLIPVVIHPLSTRCTFGVPNWSLLLFIHYLQCVPLVSQTDPCCYSSIIYKVYLWCPKLTPAVIHPLSTRCIFGIPNWSLLLFIHYLQGVPLVSQTDPCCYSSIIYKVYLWCPKLTPAVIHPLSTRCIFGIPNWSLLLFIHYLQGVSLVSQTDPCCYSSIIYKVYLWCPKLTPAVIHPLSTRCTFGVPNWSLLLFIHYLQGVSLASQTDPCCYSSIIYKVYLWHPKLIPVVIHPLSTRCTFGIPNWSLLLFIHYLQGVPLASQTDPCCYSSIIYKVYLWHPKLIPVVIHPLSTRCIFGIPNWSLLLFIHYLQGVPLASQTDPCCYSSIIYKVYLWHPKLIHVVIHPLSIRCTFGIPNWSLLLFIHYLQGVPLASQAEPHCYSSIIYKVYLWHPKLNPIVIHPLSTRCIFGVQTDPCCYSSIIYKVYLWHPKLNPIVIHPLSTRCTFGIPSWTPLLFIHYLQGVSLVSKLIPVVIHPLSTRCTFGVPSWSPLLFIPFFSGDFVSITVTLFGASFPGISVSGSHVSLFDTSPKMSPTSFDTPSDQYVNFWYFSYTVLS